MSRFIRRGGLPDMGGPNISRKRSLKQQIRDTRRLLAKDDLPETVRLTKERILKTLKGELNEKATLKQRQKVAKKYRMVKFFEKRKVVRKLSRACKEFLQVELEDAERSTLLIEIQRLKRELNYIVHFPPDAKYIALYPSSTPSSEAALAKQEELLQSIAESVERGDLPEAASLEKSICLPVDPLNHNKDTATSALGTVRLLVECSMVHSNSRQCGIRSDVELSGNDRNTQKQLLKRKASQDIEDGCESSQRKSLKDDEFFLADNDE